MRKIIKILLKIFPRPLLIRISLFFNKPLSLFFKGNNVECPVCSHTFSKFMPYGYGKANRNNRLCPNCLSLERHRLLWLYLKNRSDFFTNNHNVLHIAPEQPFLKPFKKLTNIHYTTADLVSPLADVKTDIRDMNIFDDNQFNVIICNHVLEHIDQEKKAMSELFRIMKPGGWGIFQVPIDYLSDTTFEDDSITDKRERERVFGQYDHVRTYGKDYPDRLRNVGFKVIEDNFVHSYTKEEIDRFRFDKNEIIYLCKK